VCIRDYCGNGQIDPLLGEVCDDGNNDLGDGCSSDCKSSEICGNRILDIREACDDGNTVSGDGCRSDCLVREGCGNISIDPGETCDDGNMNSDDDCPANCVGWFCGDGWINDAGTPDGGHKEYCDDMGESAFCNLNCTRSACGDFVVNATAAEQCDRGGINTSICDSDCTIPVCNDGLANLAAGEACDTAGNSATCDVDCTPVACGDLLVNPAASEVCDDSTLGRTQCPYGSQTCSACSGCTTVVTLRGPYCGDGDAGVNGGVDWDAGELCDDGNAISETGCPYGTPSCGGCSSTCTTALTLTGPYCGDGAVDAGVEYCDDGNTSACGTCSSNCADYRVQARGQITAVAGSQLVDGETFTLSDGVSTRVFEFDEDGGVTPGNILLYYPGATSIQMATAIVVGIGSTPLTISASSVFSNVTLVNTTPGIAGNQPITETVADPGFVVIGMADGGGRDCPAGTGCTSNFDCAPPFTCQPGGSGSTCQ